MHKKDDIAILLRKIIFKYKLLKTKCCLIGLMVISREIINE